MESDSKENKYKNLFKDTVIFALGSFGSKVILFFLVPLYTNFMTTAEYGTADLVTTFSSLIIPATSLVINQAVIRFGMMKGEKKEDVIVSAFIVLSVSTVITLLLTPLFGLYKSIKEWRWYLTAIIILSNYAEIERSYLKVKNKNRIYAIMGILQTAVLAIMNIILLTVMHCGVRGYLASNIVSLAAIVVCGFFAAGLQKDLRKGRKNNELLGRMIQYSFPLIFSNISWWIISSSDKIMIEWMVGAAALGVYTVATKMPSLINTIIAIFNQAWAISSIKEAESTDETSFYSSVFNLFSTVLFGACIVFIAFIKSFMQIYVGSDFRNAWTYAVFLLAAAVFYSFSAFIGTLYAAIQKTKNDMWTTVLCAIINIVINYIGIKAVGTWGAVFGTIVAYFVIANIRIIDIKRYIIFNIDLRTYCVNTCLLIIQSILISLGIMQYLTSGIIVILFILFNKTYLVKIMQQAKIILRKMKKNKENRIAL